MEPTNTNNNNIESQESHTGLIGLAVVLLLIVVGAASYLYYHKAMAPVAPIDVGTKVVDSTNCGLIVESVKQGDAVSFPLTITGTIDNTKAQELGCSWIMFEGQAGIAELLVEEKDGYSLPVVSKPIMVKDWMSTKTTFSVTLDYNNPDQLPSGYNLLLSFTEDDPSGEGIPNKVTIPVVLK